MELWNIKHLEPPPSSSCKLVNQEINLFELLKLLQEAQQTFANQWRLKLECRMLHMIIQRYKNGFRTFIGFKHLQKLNQAIRIYEEFNYKEVITSYAELVPTHHEQNLYFPSRNMLDYFLVRTQGFAKLIQRILECAKAVYIHWYNNIFLMHNIGVSIITISVASRIFILIRHLLLKVCEVYDHMHMVRDLVPNIKYNWLQEDYILPTVLRTWLNVDWVYVEAEYRYKPIKRDLVSIQLFDDEMEDDDVQFCKEYQIMQDDDDLQFINEYMTILDSDEEQELPATVVADLARVKQETQAALSEVRMDTVEVVSVAEDSKARSQPQTARVGVQRDVIDIDEDLGQPIDVEMRRQEVADKVARITSLKQMVSFLTRNNCVVPAVDRDRLLQTCYQTTAFVGNMTKNKKKKHNKEALAAVRKQIIDAIR